MDVRELSVSGAWEFTPRQFGDDRGVFLEWFKEDVLHDVLQHPFTLAQANHSVSRRGTVRGLHFAAVPPSQAKYVYCPYGSVLDVVVDIRVGSPTFGSWDSVVLDTTSRRAVYLSEGLGHAFCALEDNSVVTYLCSTPYNPQREFGVHPNDPALGLPWPTDIELLLSPKDEAAPTLAQAEADGILPTWDDCLAWQDELRHHAG